jgi:twitching motility protein PilT
VPEMDRQLGEVLVEQGFVTQEQLQAAAAEEARTGHPAWRVLIDRDELSERDLVRARAHQAGLEFVNLQHDQPDPAALGMIPADVARRQLALPMHVGDAHLVVAMAEPRNHFAIDELARVSGRQIVPAAAFRADMATAIDRAYSQITNEEHDNGAPEGPRDPLFAPVPPPPASPEEVPAAEFHSQPMADAPEHAVDHGIAPAQVVEHEVYDTHQFETAPEPGPATGEADGNGSGFVSDVVPFAADDLPMVEAPEPVAATVEVVSEPDEKEPNFAEFLIGVIDKGGSDLHLTAGLPPMIRINGELQPLKGFRRLEPKDLQELIYAILTQKQRENFEENLELDLSYSLPGKARFRVNVFQQRDALGAVMRLIPFEIKAPDQLGIPESVVEFANLKRGLVLVTGITGSGKSTTLAALIDIINDSRHEHIMTVEDPIEFLHRHKKAVINQREVGTDTHGFKEALKRVLRQDPDVILVGEMRDLETISTALTAAETGHLVFGTLHTQDAPQSIDRVIDVFPPHQQQQIRVQLAGTIAGVVSQQLLKTADGKGRAVAVEVLVATPAVRNLIREGKTHQIYTSMQAGGKFGMQVMDQDLARLVKTGKVTYENALEHCHRVEEFNRLAGRG